MEVTGQQRSRQHTEFFRNQVSLRVCERGGGGGGRSSRPTLIDYTAIDRDPEKQALTFLLIELNTFYGANQWDGDDGGVGNG